MWALHAKFQLGTVLTISKSGISNALKVFLKKSQLGTAMNTVSES